MNPKPELAWPVTQNEVPAGHNQPLELVMHPLGGEEEGIATPWALRVAATTVPLR
jgi:hypothetical protein